MNTKDTIRETLNLSHFILSSYLKDLADADLLNAPARVVRTGISWPFDLVRVWPAQWYSC
jgi:hypothetical protein